MNMSIYIFNLRFQLKKRRTFLVNKIERLSQDYGLFAKTYKLFIIRIS